jgi:thiamine biosynthesis lipoprotein
MAADRRSVGFRLFCLLLMSVLLPVLRARGSQSLNRYEYSLPRMGTVFNIVLYAANQETASLAANAAFERIEQLEQKMSDYREDSEIRRLGREAVWNPRPVSRDLFFVLENSLRISRLTGGAFDVTVGPEVALWREARREGRMPDVQSLARAKAAVGYGNLELDPSTRTVLLKHEDMKLDLGGIAKGYAADEAIRLLRSRGIRCALVDGGGDISLGDAPPGEPGWRIAVYNPDSTSGRDCFLTLHNLGVATSGDAYQHLDVGRRRYSHIVNPADGIGISDSPSTTLIAPDGMSADALATALSILSVPEALRTADSIDGVSVSLCRRVDGRVRRLSSGRFPRLQETARPAAIRVSGND